MSQISQLQAMDAGTRRREARTVIASSYLGSTIEYYDFLLYATAAAVVFPKVFFSGADEWVGVVAAYGTFAAGYVARPLGGIIFGHFGDRLGRKNMLIVSMLVMGIASTLIGLVPGAAVAGAWGAVMLVILRVCQGIAVGGEWGGAALMALEHSESGKRGFAASFVNAGAPTGAVLGTLVMGAFAALPNEQFLAWGWRVPVPAVLRPAGHRHVRPAQGLRKPHLQGGTGTRESRAGTGRTGQHPADGAGQRAGAPGDSPPAGPAPAQDPDLHHAGRRGRVCAPGGAGHVLRDLRRVQGRGPAGRSLRLRGRLLRVHRLRDHGRPALRQAGTAARHGRRPGALHPVTSRRCSSSCPPTTSG